MSSKTTAAAPTVAYEDFSGVSNGHFDNPYDALIEASNNDPKQLQEKYNAHRQKRNAQQKEKILSPDFTGVNIDNILLRLVDPTVEPGFVDPRNCLVYWGRPTQKVRKLIHDVQQKLLEAVPDLWIMPQDSCHITALEVTHSRTAEEIRSLVDTLQPSISKIVNYTYNHRARLIKPMVGYDAAALALSFVPAAGEALSGGRTEKDDAYTYHHLRRDLYGVTEEAGVKIDSRYIVPSAHLTIGRFITTKSLTKDDDGSKPDPEKLKKMIEKIEQINAWLEAEYWPKNDGSRIKDGGEWIVGEEKGLDFRQGTLWYGSGGQTVELGKGF